MSASIDDQVAQLHQQAQEAADRNDLAAAQKLAEQAAELVKTQLGEDNPAYANALFVQASVARMQGDLPGANRLYEQAVGIMEKIPGRDADLANSLIVLSQRYAEQGNQERAAQLRQRARKVILERLPIDDNLTLNLAAGLGRAAAKASEEEALSIDQELAQAAAKADRPRPALFFFARTAGHFANQKRLDEASRAAQQAQSWLEKLDAQLLGSIPGALLELGNVYLTLNQAAQAEAVFQRAAGLLTDQQPATLAARIDAVFGLGKACRKQRDWARAEAFYQEAFSRSARLYGKDDPRTAAAAAQVGGFYIDQEQYGLARDYLAFALEVREAKLGRDDLLVAETLNDLGMCEDQTGRYAPAEGYYRRALAIYAARLPRSDPDALTTVFNLAELARIQGDVPTAEKRFRDALEIPGIPDDLLALLKNNLGELYTYAGRLDEARPLLLEALALRNQVFGVGSEKSARSLESLGSLEFAEQHYPAAKEYFEQARAIFQKENARRFANSAAFNIAKAVAFGGDIPTAIGLLEAAVEEARAAYGPRHINVAGAMIQLALFYAVQAEWQKTRETILAAVQMEDENLVEILLSASRSHSELLLADARKSLGLYLGALLNDPQATVEDIRSGYVLIQRRKGLEARLLRMLKPGQGAPPWKAKQYAAWIGEQARLRSQLAQAQLAARDQRSPKQADPQLAELREQISEIEKRLAEAGLERTVETIIYPVPAHAVAAALPKKSALVEFVNVPDYAEGIRRRGTAPQRYAAFVLKAGENPEENILGDVDTLETVFAMKPVEDSPAPVLVDLGEAAQIDAGVSELLSAVDFGDDGKGTPRWQRKGRYLFTRLIEPLEAELKDAEHLIFAPDGALHALPFEILADGQGELLLKRCATSYVQVGREVIRFWEHFNRGGPPLVIADPDFDLPAGQSPRAGETEMISDERLAALQDAPRFADLAYTLAEGQAVAAVLQAPLYSGAAAVEGLLKQGQPAEIIHIATHGFYLRRKESAAGAQDILEARATLDDALERSGLVLAGANAYLDLKTPPANADDGILFAAEIVDLDLSRTDLVCLSACQSGQGDIRLGEGLKGLRSAFSAAGCRSLVCALWEIPDQASQQLIELFYGELLKGTPRAAALRSAKQALQKDYPRDALFWAGLVLDGNPAALQRFSPLGDLTYVSINAREWGLNPPPRPEPGTPAREALDLYEQGRALLKQGKRADALQAFEAAVQVRGAPEETVRLAQYEHAGVLRQSGRYEEALQAYALLLAQPDLADHLRISALGDRATTYLLSGQFEAGIRDISLVLESTGLTADHQARLLVNRGYAYTMMGQAAEAIADYSAVLALDGAPRGQQFKALLNRGDTYRNQENYPAAIADLSQAMEMSEGRSEEIIDARFSRGLAYYGMGDDARAIADFDLLLEDNTLSPDNRKVCLTCRARCHQFLGHAELARADYRALLALPGVSDAVRAEAQAALNQKP